MDVEFSRVQNSEFGVSGRARSGLHLAAHGAVGRPRPRLPLAEQLGHRDHHAASSPDGIPAAAAAQQRVARVQLELVRLPPAALPLLELLIGRPPKILVGSHIAALPAAAAAAAGGAAEEKTAFDVLLAAGSSSKKKKPADGPLAHRLEAAAQAVKQAYSECPSFDDLVPALLEHGVDRLHEFVHFRPGVPVRPMLAKPTCGVSEVLDKFAGQEFTCEFKYDGERAQVHVLEDGTVKIYSRNAEDNTTKYPDIAAVIPRVLKPGTTSIVFDAEAVAYDRENDQILPFQVLSTRARKGVKLADVKIAVCLFAFDCLYVNGQPLLTAPLTERREALYGALAEVPGEFEYAKYKTSTDVEELAAFLDESVAACTEGLIVKTMDATYEPSRRSTNWLKLKKDYLDGVGDTFDVVPIGAWFGRGKRTGGYGAFLLAVYNPEEEEYQTISKIGTGFSEEVLKQLSASLAELAVDKPRAYYRYGDTLVPDVWFDAKQVWEVKAADLSISPVHKAATGLVDSAKGISIRFPRLVRVRDDKKPEEATSAEQVAEMYRSQASTQHTNGNGNGGKQQAAAAAAADDE